MEELYTNHFIYGPGAFLHRTETVDHIEIQEVITRLFQFEGIIE